MSRPTPPRNFLGLDLLRFSAALAVVMYHLAYFWWLPAYETRYSTLFRDGLAPLRVARWGWVGVQIFFVLSGLVIAFSAQGKSVGEFIKARVLRLYPAVWICAIMTLIGARWGDAGAMAAFARSMILSPIGPWISGVYWTLEVELAFYLMVAVLLARGGRIVHLGLGLAGLSAVYWSLRAVDFASGGHGKAAFAAIETTDLGNLTLLTSGCHFALGILLWSTVCERPTRVKTLAVAVCVVSGLIGLAGNARGRIVMEGGATWEVAEPLLMWLVAVACIGASVRWNVELEARIGRWSSTVKTLGLLTYPLYLVHSELGRIIMLRCAGIGAAPALAIALAAVLLFAWIALKLEPTVRRLLRRVIAPTARSGALPSTMVP